MNRYQLDVVLAGLFGVLAVAFGAFGAHGLSDPKAIGWMHTAGLYAGLHALALLGVAALRRTGFTVFRFTRTFFAVGVFLFSGSLALMAIGGPRWLGMVTPVGGIAFMFGWMMLLWAGGRHQD